MGFSCPQAVHIVTNEVYDARLRRGLPRGRGRRTKLARQAAELDSADDDYATEI